MSAVLKSQAGLRTLAGTVRARPAQPAPGLLVDRPLPAPEIQQVSPFLMIDHFGPKAIPAGSSGGLNPHPHRGFATVTLLLEGAMEHRDSAGNRGVIRKDGVQWMTAASGVLHAEYLEAEFARTGGTQHGIQLWVNLPAKDKMVAPGYQDLPAESHAVVSRDGATLRLVAGEALGARGPARSHTPMMVARVTLAPGASIELPAPREWNALAYVVESGTADGEGVEVADGEAWRALARRHMAVWNRDGGTIGLRAGEAAAELLVLTGAPIEEPVVSWGPFVMNTREEIQQAQRDYSSGKMGRPEGVPF